MTGASRRRRRSPWQALYTAGHRLRGRWHAGRARSLPRPVLSVGNLHWGGTGKTPITLALAAWLRDEGRRVCVLSRGYGRRSRGPLIVGRGKGPLVSAIRGGDEPYLLARELPGVAVAVARRRVEAGLLALAELAPAPDLFLLDDGFTHLRLRRDVDLLVLPADDPLGGEALFPAGRLREPPEAASRADAVLVAGTRVPDSIVEEVTARLRGWEFAGPVFPAVLETGSPLTEAGDPIPPGEPLLLVTGVARGERVADALEALGHRVSHHLAFPDHHPYPPRSLARIRAAADEAGATRIVTTGKDAAKLAGRLPLPMAIVPHRARLDPALLGWLRTRLGELG